MEDQRQTELECIAAIFPEISFDENDPFSASLEIPVQPHSPVKVSFLAPRSAIGVGEPDTDVHEISYFPSLQLHIKLPEGYPENTPPEFKLSTAPGWIPPRELRELELVGEQKWSETGHNLVVYDYLDFLQQAAKNTFELGRHDQVLEIPFDHKLALLDFNVKAAKAAFDLETFGCGVCLGECDWIHCVSILTSSPRL